MKILLLAAAFLLSASCIAQKFTVTNGIVSADSWGSDNDITQELDEAILYAAQNKASGIQLPTGNYRRTATIIFKSSINLIGTGTSQQPATRIGFPANVKCVYIPYRGMDGYIMYSGIKDVDFYQDAANTYFDTTAHGVHVRSHVRLENVLVSQASGNGFQLEGCQSTGHPLEGQIDFSEVINCHARYVNTGLFIQGCDANMINVYKFNATACRRWGIYDDGFLGNMYTSPHFAFCGSGTFSDVVTIYNGQHYSAISTEDIINKGFRPDLYPQYWRPVDPMGNAKEWTPTQRYWSGGPYNITGLNARSIVDQPYMEAYQPDAMQQQSVMSFGGIRGAAIHGGMDMRNISGLLAISSSLALTAANSVLTVNEPSTGYGASISAKANSGNTPSMFHESSSDGPYVFERYKNSLNDKGAMYYDNTDFKFYADNINSFSITPKTIKLLRPDTSTSASHYKVVWDGVTKELKVKPDVNGNAPGNSSGVSQSAFDALETKYNALETKVNSLDAILAKKASKEDVTAVSALVQALTVRVNALPTGSQPNPQLTQILSELQSIINRLNNFNN